MRPPEEIAKEVSRLWHGDGLFDDLVKVIAAAQAEAVEAAAMVAISHRWGMRHEPGETIARDIRALAPKVGR